MQTFAANASTRVIDFGPALVGCSGKRHHGPLRPFMLAPQRTSQGKPDSKEPGLPVFCPGSVPVASR